MVVMLLKTGLRYLLRRPLISLLCVLGVALGVAVVIAIDLANASASKAFNLSTETVAGKATHQIIGSDGTLDESVYRAIRVDLGIVEAAPVVAAYAVAFEMDQQPLRVLGVDAFAEPPFRSYLGSTSSGRPDFNLGKFFTDPDAILLGDAAAQRFGLKIGSTVTFRVGDQRKTVRVAGIAQDRR